MGGGRLPQTRLSRPSLGPAGSPSARGPASARPGLPRQRLAARGAGRPPGRASSILCVPARAGGRGARPRPPHKRSARAPRPRPGDVRPERAGAWGLGAGAVGPSPRGWCAGVCGASSAGGCGAGPVGPAPRGAVGPSAGPPAPPRTPVWRLSSGGAPRGGGTSLWDLRLQETRDVSGSEKTIFL